MKTTLWTIQDQQGWNELQSKGILIPKSKFVHPDFKEGYDWLRIQMNEKIGKPKRKNQYPIWAWFQYLDAKKKRPDLRGTGFLPTGEIGYRIEFQKDSKDILLSDFELWHYVLNQWYLGSNIKDQEDFHELEDSRYKGLSYQGYPKSIKNKIQKSWQRIFDMNYAPKDISWRMEKKSIQATCWSLKLSDVIKVDKFMAR